MAGSRIPSQQEPEDGDAIDLSKRYDIYCRDALGKVNVYENAIFKGKRSLFKKTAYDVLADFIEVELANGQTGFISRPSVFKFCEHGTDFSGKQVGD